MVDVANVILMSISILSLKDVFPGVQIYNSSMEKSASANLVYIELKESVNSVEVGKSALQHTEDVYQDAPTMRSFPLKRDACARKDL